MSAACKNCDTALIGKYCANCGQSAQTHRYTMAHIGHEVFHSITHTDKSALDFLWLILTRPGHVAHDLFVGKRQRYFNMFTLFVITTTIFILAVGFSHYYDYMGAQRLAAEGTGMQGINKKAFELMTHYSRVLFFAFLPINALVTFLLFRKQRYNYAEHLVYNILMFPAYLLFIALLSQLVWIDPSFVTGIDRVIQTGVIVYMCIGNRQLFRESWLATILKTILARVIQITVIWLLATLVAAFLV